MFSSSRRLIVTACSAVAVACLPFSSYANPVPTVPQLLERFLAAADDPGSPALNHYTITGTLTGDGLSGTFTLRHDGENERDDQALGPRTETTWLLGDRAFAGDGNGDVRELRGVLLRRARTERFIDSEEFAHSAEHVRFRGIQTIEGRSTYVIDVTAPGGEPESLALDAQTGLVDQIAYDDDDGRTTVNLSDWHTVAGHRIAYQSVTSNGDRAFDVTETATSVDATATIDPQTYVVPHTRTIDAAESQTVSLRFENGHFYVPVKIGGVDYSFLLDTGASNILLDERVARAAGLREEGALQANGASRTGGLHTARLPDLQIGSAHLRGLVVSTIDLGAATQGAFRIDGVLGYPFYASSIVKLDPAAHTLTFGPPGSIVPSGKHVDLELDRLLPEALVRLMGRTNATMVVDTGNAGGVLLYKPYVDANPGIVPMSTLTQQTYGIGGATASYRTRLDELDFGGIPLYHLDADVMLATQGAFADRFVSGNVGLSFLQNFVLTFDEANSALYVEQSSLFDDGRERS